MAACAELGLETVHLLAPPQTYEGGPLELNIVEEEFEIKGAAPVDRVTPPSEKYLQVLYVGRELEVRNFELRGVAIGHLEVVIWEITGEVRFPVSPTSYEYELRTIKLSVTHRVEVPRGH